MTPLPEKLPGEGFLKKIWTTVDNGLGGLLTPWQMKRVGKYRLAPILSAGSSKRPRVTTMW
jgi:hypothetical protein